MIGLTVAMATTAFRVVRESVMPLVTAAQAVPKVGARAAGHHVVRLGSGSKIALAVLLSFFPILVSAMAGFAATPADLGELARSLSASRWQTYRHFRLPWALPQIFVGLRLGAVFALIGAVVAQITTPERWPLGQWSSCPDSTVTPPCLRGDRSAGRHRYRPLLPDQHDERLLLPWSTPITTPPS